MGDPEFELNVLGKTPNSSDSGKAEGLDAGGSENGSAAVNSWTESNITIRGAEIRCARVGSGSPVLLLHGWSSSLDAFKPLAMDLSRSFEVVCLDFPGHGESDLPDGAWGVSDFVSVVEELLDRLGLPSVDIVAHSFGARVAAKLAASEPGRVGRMVLMGAAGIRLRRSMKLRARSSVLRLAKTLAPFAGAAGRRWKHDLVQRYASRDYLDAGELRPTFVKVINEDLSSSYGAVRAETLLLWGEDDQETPLPLGRRMHELVENSKLMIVKGAGHFVFVDKFQQVRLATRRFLTDGLTLGHSSPRVR